MYRSTVDKLYWGRRYLTREFFEIAGRDFRRQLRPDILLPVARVTGGAVQQADLSLGEFRSSFAGHRAPIRFRKRLDRGALIVVLKFFLPAVSGSTYTSAFPTASARAMSLPFG